MDQHGAKTDVSLVGPSLLDSPDVGTEHPADLAARADELVPPRKSAATFGIATGESEPVFLRCGDPRGRSGADVTRVATKNHRGEKIFPQQIITIGGGFPCVNTSSVVGTLHDKDVMS